MSKREVTILIFSGFAGILIGAWYQKNRTQKIVEKVFGQPSSTSSGFMAASAAQQQQNIATMTTYLQSKGVDTSGLTSDQIMSEGYNESTGDTVFISANPELFASY